MVQMIHEISVRGTSLVSSIEFLVLDGLGKEMRGVKRAERGIFMLFLVQNNFCSYFPLLGMERYSIFNAGEPEPSKIKMASVNFP